MPTRTQRLSKHTHVRLRLRDVSCVIVASAGVNNDIPLALLRALPACNAGLKRRALAQQTVNQLMPQHAVMPPQRQEIGASLHPSLRFARETRAYSRDCVM
jgi:hypothetical protein